MPTKTVARCSIYENRPDVCRNYPQIYHYVPGECTFWFAGEDRQGECGCEVGACCSLPREGGIPGGAPLPEEAGGAPCKYLVWEDVMEKEASVTAPSGPLDWAVDLERWAVGDT